MSQTAIDYDQLARSVLAGAAPDGTIAGVLDLTAKLGQAREEANRQRLRAEALEQQVGRLETSNAELSRRLRERGERKSYQEIKEVIAAVEKCDWTAELRNTGHYHLTGPNGEKYTCSSTPSDHRSIKNHVADLRRLGAPI